MPPPAVSFPFSNEMFFFLVIAGDNPRGDEWHSEVLCGRNIAGYDLPTVTLRFPKETQLLAKEEGGKAKYSFNDNRGILKALSISTGMPF